jgi:DNA polymerase V
MKKSGIKKSKELEFFRPDTSTKIKLPFYIASVSAGFPSPAEDYLEKELDLNEHLIRHPAATFFVRVSGNSMKDIGILPGDILIVDRSLEAKDGKIIIGVINGEFTVKRIIRQGKKIFLQPENAKYNPIEITQEMDFDIWGVVSYSIHKH